ncbi:MAG: TonB family protein [Endozoicomonas sp.]
MLRRLLIPVLFVFSLTAKAEESLRLAGVGFYTELSASYFYGALYTSADDNDASAILADGIRNRIAMRISARQLKPGRFFKLWNSTLAINNSGAELERYSDEVVDFTMLLKGRLSRGDEVVIEEVGGNTRVTINGIEVGNYGAPGFMRLLVRGWIGPLPPLMAFKDDILGRSDENSTVMRLAEFDSLLPEAGRADAIRGWFREPAYPVLTAPTVSAPESKEVEPLETADKKKEAEGPVVVSKPAEPSQEEKNRQEAERLLKEEEEKAAADAMALEDEKEKGRLLALQEQARLKKIQEIESEYYQVLIRHANQHAKYPKQALRFNSQGYVRVKVTINSGGEVQDAVLLEGAKARSLDRAAMKAVEKAAPFPRLPSELAGTEYEFVVPFRFILSGENTDYYSDYR